MITDATRAKMAMQIPVTNQKTKSIRPACLLAEWGSQGISSATAAAPAPHATPIATSWTIDPLRTANETTRPPGRSGVSGGDARAGRCAVDALEPRGRPQLVEAVSRLRKQRTGLFDTVLREQVLRMLEPRDGDVERRLRFREQLLCRDELRLRLVLGQPRPEASPLCAQVRRQLGRRELVDDVQELTDLLVVIEAGPGLERLEAEDRLRPGDPGARRKRALNRGKRLCAAPLGGVELGLQ